MDRANVSGEMETDSKITDKFNSIFDSLNTPPIDEDFFVTNSDIIFTIVSIFSRVNSIVSTLLLSYSYHRQEKFDYFAWTLCCFLIPMAVTTLLQLMM